MYKWLGEKCKANDWKRGRKRVGIASLAVWCKELAMHQPGIGRRAFLKRTAVVAASAPLFVPRIARGASAGEKLNVALIGVSGQGAYHLQNIAAENVVALCDVDDTFLRGAAEKHKEAKTYNDFRKLLEQKNIEAVVISTPDHTHAVIAAAALKSGRHVYCEKPLTRTVSETRALRKLAAETGKVTQMGTQIHAGDNYRRVVELIQKGAIGPVKEVHVWVNTVYGGKTKPTEAPPVPPGLHYDLWLGPIQPVPYHQEYLPFKWRNWWAFGGGGLADFGCHYMDLPHWALDLRGPVTVESEGPEVSPVSPPLWQIVRYEYPSRGEQPPVKLTWHHGGKHPEQAEPLLKDFASGVLFVGEKGQLVADYGKHKLLPEKDFEGFKRPEQFIAKSLGHHREWIEAIKNNGKTTCNFDYSGALTEAVLLGNAAYRAGKKLEWDDAGMKVKNTTEADKFIQHEYREGWRL